MSKLKYVVAGAAIGAAAVVLADKKNRDKIVKKAEKIKAVAIEEGKKLKAEGEDAWNTLKDKGDDAKKTVEEESKVIGRKAKAALKAARTTK